MKSVGKHLSEWALDQSNTVFEFQVRHMVVSTVTGKFSRFSGVMRGDPESLTDSVVDLVLEGSSLDTHDRMRDKKLKGENFFNVSKFPHIRFWSTGIDRRDDGKYKVTGQLKIKDVTKQIALLCETSEREGEYFSFVVTGKLNTEDFGIKWKSFFDPGNVLVGSSVKLTARGKFKLENSSEF